LAKKLEVKIEVPNSGIFSGRKKRVLQNVVVCSVRRTQEGKWSGRPRREKRRDPLR
jgi:hypothetical protein